MSAVEPAILSIDHVGVRFGGLVAIADLHFDVKPGEIVSLIGPNGAGKTTAFNVMTGFLRPSQGEVRFRGTSLKGLQPYQIVRLGLSRTFQRTSVFPDDTVFDNVM
ncbi:MAG TPA: ATP-binding cassette domain-containing protein, partial [Methylobacterium sp.]